MQILYHVLVLLLAAISFYAGKRVSDSYNASQIQELQFQLRLMAAEKGVGYVAPPVNRRMPIGQPFMDSLKEKGRAVQKINPQP